MLALFFIFGSFHMKIESDISLFLKMYDDTKRIVNPLKSQDAYMKEKEMKEFFIYFRLECDSREQIQIF